MTTQTGWIGLGKMGLPMAMNLIGKGYQLTVFNRSPRKCEPLAKAGAKVADSITQLAEQADVLFSMISDDTALRQVLLGPDGALNSLRPGAILIDMSTVSVGASRDVAEAAEARDIRYLRAPVSGSVTLAEAGSLTVIASGSASAYDSVQELFSAISARQFFVGDGDEARIVKLSINLMVGFTAAMTGEALALGLKHGVERQTMLDVMGASAVASPLLGYKLDTLRARNFAPAFEVSQMAKDFDLVLAAGRSSATPLPLAALVREGWNALIAQGDGGEDFFKYTEHVAHNAGIEEAQPEQGQER